jgi:hypothetical protein
MRDAASVLPGPTILPREELAQLKLSQVNATSRRESVDLGNGKATLVGKRAFKIRALAMLVFIYRPAVPYF